MSKSSWLTRFIAAFDSYVVADESPAASKTANKLIGILDNNVDEFDVDHAEPTAYIGNALLAAVAEGLEDGVDTSYTVITDTRILVDASDNWQDIEYKTRTISVTDGIVTTVSDESEWTKAEKVVV